MMIIYPIKNEDNPYILSLSKYRRAKDYMFAAMQILSLSFRGLAEVCEYSTDEEFEVFIRRFTKGHRLLVKSPMFTTLKSIIDNELRRKYRNEMANEDLEVVRQKENCNRNNKPDSK